MKISRIEIENFRQFKDLKLNLTYPEGHKKAGQPLDKICIIGQSGTGKTTLLELIASIDLGLEFQDGAGKANRVFRLSPSLISTLVEDCVIKLKVHLGDKPYVLSSNDTEDDNEKRFFDGDYSSENTPGGYIMQSSITNSADFVRANKRKIFYVVTQDREIYRLKTLDEGQRSREESMSINASEYVTSSSVDKTWEYFKYLLSLENNVYENQRSKLLTDIEIYKEKNEWEKVEEATDQLRSLYNILDMQFQKVLSPILDLFGLTVDNDIRRAISAKQIILKTKSGKILNFDLLSSGIKKILRMAVFFRVRLPQSSIILIDEPENSFFPDIQSKLVDFHVSQGKNCQFLFATHSPIIASDFDPWEVIDLEFDSDGYVIRNEHLKDKEKGWHIDNFDYNPKWLTYQGIYRRFFDLDAVSHPDRADKLTEAALLKAESEKLQKEGKIEEARKKFDAYVTLSQQLR